MKRCKQIKTCKSNLTIFNHKIKGVWKPESRPAHNKHQTETHASVHPPQQEVEQDQRGIQQDARRL